MFILLTRRDPTVPYIHEFIMITIVHLLAVISPGPDFAIVIRQSISFGRKTAIITSLGIAAGISVHIAYTLLGIGFIISQSPTIFMIMKLIGAAYISYISLSLLRSKPQNTDNSNIKIDINPDHHKKAFALGFMTNVLNPKVTIFFLAIFTTVVSVDTPIAIQSIYGAWIITSTALWFIIVSFFFSHQKVRDKFVTHGYLFERLMGMVLLFFAAKIIFDLF